MAVIVTADFRTVKAEVFGISRLSIIANKDHACSSCRLLPIRFDHSLPSITPQHSQVPQDTAGISLLRFRLECTTLLVYTILQVVAILASSGLSLRASVCLPPELSPTQLKLIVIQGVWPS